MIQAACVRTPPNPHCPRVRPSQPLALGADVSIHSATKFLNGHSDLQVQAPHELTHTWRCLLLDATRVARQAGVAVSSAEHIEMLRQNVIMYGGGLNAESAYQLERGMMT